MTRPMQSLPEDDENYLDYYQVVRRIIDGLFLSLGYHPDNDGGTDRYNQVIEKFSEVLKRPGDLRSEAMESLAKNHEKFVADTHTLLEGLTNDKHRRALFGAIIALDELNLSGKP